MDNTPDFILLRSRRRSISIHVSPNAEVIIKAPFRISDKYIKDFVIEKQDWIKKAMSKMQKHKPKQYITGEEFMYLGNIYKLNIGDYKHIHITPATAGLNFPNCLLFRAKKEIEEWYIKQAKEVITARVEHYSKVMKAKYKSIMFSDTKSKWGSCAPDNALQFNWKLVMTPHLVIDYVVVHELVHTWEKNHSHDFWKKVVLYKPAYKQHRKWLEDNTHRLVI